MVGLPEQALVASGKLAPVWGIGSSHVRLLSRLYTGCWDGGMSWFERKPLQIEQNLVFGQAM